MFISGVLVSSCFKQRHAWTRLESSPVDPASSQGVTQISAVESPRTLRSLYAQAIATSNRIMNFKDEAWIAARSFALIETMSAWLK